MFNSGVQSFKSCHLFQFIVEEYDYKKKVSREAMGVLVQFCFICLWLASIQWNYFSYLIVDIEKQAA